MRRRAARTSGRGPAADLRQVHATLIAGADRRVHARGCGRWRGPRMAHLGTRHALTWEPCAHDCPWPEAEAEEMPMATRGSRLSRWLTLALLILIPIVSSLWSLARPTAAAPACPAGQVTMAAAGGDVSASLEASGSAGSVLLRLCTTGGVVSSWTASATPRAGGATTTFEVVRVRDGAALGTASLPAGQEWLLAVELITESGERRTASSYITS
ncbi:hypothetical protein [Catenuloplanes japonicus]|uniref:hypothetical protein n=1 Tax=Catenuloplanes japonicus TaxID=33876 RepID=UPI000A9D71FF|nr:hypothetical protein [Catenuloplanes japonicus]